MEAAHELYFTRTHLNAPERILCLRQTCRRFMISAMKHGYVLGPNGLYFKVFNHKVSWTKAQANCEAKNGSLAILNSPDLVQFSMEVLGETRAWIGATDTEVEGKWMWMTGQKVQHPQKYDMRYDMANQDCGSIKDGVLLDHYCDKPVMPITKYFCEFKRRCSIVN